MPDADELRPVKEMIEEYISLAREELRHRWEAWTRSLNKIEEHEVLGGLLARQVSVATQLAATPSVWNPHIAPLFLRTMVDLHITLMWILRDPTNRARQFVLYGLGQSKLYIEHLKAWGERTGEDVSEAVKALETWQNAQRLADLTEVNVGAWAGMNARQMADEVGELELYNLAYVPFSAAVHNMWSHVVRFNLAPCDSPLHRYHRIPIDRDFIPDPDYLYRAAKYLEKSFKFFDAAVGLSSAPPSAFDSLVRRLEALGSSKSEPDD